MLSRVLLEWVAVLVEIANQVLALATDDILLLPRIVRR